MKIEVVVKTNSQKAEVSHLKGNTYSARLCSRPHENMANVELIGVLSEYFQCPKSSIKILRGLKSKIKLVEIDIE